MTLERYRSATGFSARNQIPIPELKLRALAVVRASLPRVILVGHEGVDYHRQLA